MIKQARLTFIIASISGALAVILGAFGAHALEASVTPERIETWETGVLYHFFHTLLLLFIGNQLQKNESRSLVWSGRLILAGIIIFSGSLYLLVLTDTGWLGAITPIGGISFILGWFLLATHYYKTKPSES